MAAFDIRSLLLAIFVIALMQSKVTLLLVLLFANAAIIEKAQELSIWQLRLTVGWQCAQQFLDGCPTRALATFTFASAFLLVKHRVLSGLVGCCVLTA